MSDFALSGLATGLDTATVIQQLMAIEKRPVVMLQQNQAKTQSKMDLFRQLNTKLSALQTAAQAVKGSSLATSPMASTKATSSDSNYFTVTSDATAGVGSFSVNVIQLAKEQKTGGGTFGPNPGGTLNISFNTTDSNGNPIVSSKAIAINAGDDVNTVAANINAANAGMGATVINGKLMLTGKKTGIDYTLSDGAGGALVNGLGLGGANLQNAQQAKLKIDGQFDVVSDSNTVTNAMTGVTINLFKAHATAADSTTLSVAADQQPAVDKIKDLVAKYNDVVSFIAKNNSYDKDKKTAGAFLGDSFINSLSSDLTRMFNETVDPTADGTTTFARANQVGISLNKDGTFSLDETKLKAALTENSTSVYKLFANEDNQWITDANGAMVKLNSFGSGATAGDGIANRLSAYVEQLVSRSSLYNHTSPDGGRYVGSLLTRLDTMQSSIDSQSKQIDAYNQRLTLRERNLRSQFTAMETAVQKMRDQGNWLSSQLSGMYASSR